MTRPVGFLPRGTPTKANARADQAARALPAVAGASQISGEVEGREADRPLDAARPGHAFRSVSQVTPEDPMAEKNRKKTYLILIVILLVVLLITYL